MSVIASGRQQSPWDPAQLDQFVQQLPCVMRIGEAGDPLGGDECGAVPGLTSSDSESDR
jgi:hypothetical protein